MTGTEKAGVACFLDTAGDFLAGRYRRARDGYAFPDDSADGGSTADGRRAADVGRAADNAAFSPIEGGDSLEAAAADIARCGRCELCKTRTTTVPGEGAEKPLVMVIGEGPGADEDRTGRPFVGRAGQLLDRILDSRGKIGLFRNTNCYIANVVKCRPPGNRNPLPEEIAACAPFLRRQIALIRPKVILAAGSVAARALLQTGEGITKLRGKWTVYEAEGGFLDGEGGAGNRTIPLLPTFHPSALLRDESLRAPVWEDMKTLRARLCELDAEYAAKMSGVPL